MANNIEYEILSIPEGVKVFDANVDNYELKIGEYIDLERIKVQYTGSSVNYFYIETLTESSTTINFTNRSGSLFYSFSNDKIGNWVPFPNDNNEITVNKKQKVYFKGNLGISTSGIGHISGTSEFNVGGELVSLISGDSFVTASTTKAPSKCFSHLFGGNINLISAEDLIFPDTVATGNSAKGTYEYMFSWCKNLNTPPKFLPAKVLNKECYCGMFSNCIGLTTAPEILAEVLEENSCQAMFNSCSGLTIPPDLSNIKTLNGSGCCLQMFSGCTSLMLAPSILPAETLTKYCYAKMFQNCYKLASSPELPATNLAEGCYSGMFLNCSSLVDAHRIGNENTTAITSAFTYMFSGCTLLTTAPELPAKTLQEKCYYQLFKNLPSLETVPLLGATTFGKRCCEEMFMGCRNLETVCPIGTENATMLDYSCDSMFEKCTSLVIAPKLPAITLGEGTYYEMFKECVLLKTVPSLSATSFGPICYSFMFQGCTNLRNVCPIGTKNTTMSRSCCAFMFQNCVSLAIPPELPATALTSSCYQGMFDNCTSLTTAPELPATTLASYCYRYMFYGCTSLTTVPSNMLPATTLEQYCYGSMFYGCTLLTTAPKLPATTLEQYCYYNMFNGCTSLTTVPTSIGNSNTEMPIKACDSMFWGCTSLTTAPELPATKIHEGCYDFMFLNCTSLNKITCLAKELKEGLNKQYTEHWTQGVAATGTFIRHENSFDWSTGVNGIPNNWTVETASS